jgi:hypothetical protein
MKTGYWKSDWLAPLVGIAVVGGSLMAATTYVNLEQRVSANEALSATLDHLYQDQKLSVALRILRDGQVDNAAQRVDLVLCQNILRLESQLASADPRTRAYIEDAFRRIAQFRPKIDPTTSGGEYNEDQAAAERVLASAVGASHIAQTK